MAKSTAQVTTPQSMDDPEKVKVEAIPLPPEEMWRELDNSGEATDVAAQPSPAEPAWKPEVAALAFVNNPVKTVPLSYPFKLDGGTIAEICVRRLTVAEVGQLIESLPVSRRDNFDIYAAMTGLPAAVLRGLIDEDGERVVGVCYDFFARVFRPASAPPSVSTNGAEIVGLIAATLNAPLFTLLARPWDEALRWWPAAKAVHAETFGLLKRL